MRTRSRPNRGRSSNRCRQSVHCPKHRRSAGHSCGQKTRINGRCLSCLFKLGKARSSACGTMLVPPSRPQPACVKPRECVEPTITSGQSGRPAVSLFNLSDNPAAEFR